MPAPCAECTRPELWRSVLCASVQRKHCTRARLASFAAHLVAASTRACAGMWAGWSCASRGRRRPTRWSWSASSKSSRSCSSRRAPTWRRWQGSSWGELGFSTKVCSTSSRSLGRLCIRCVFLHRLAIASFAGSASTAFLAVLLGNRAVFVLAPMSSRSAARCFVVLVLPATALSRLSRCSGSRSGGFCSF